MLFLIPPAAGTLHCAFIVGGPLDVLTYNVGPALYAMASNSGQPHNGAGKLLCVTGHMAVKKPVGVRKKLGIPLF